MQNIGINPRTVTPSILVFHKDSALTVKVNVNDIGFITIRGKCTTIYLYFKNCDNVYERRKLFFYFNSSFYC